MVVVRKKSRTHRGLATDNVEETLVAERVLVDVDQMGQVGVLVEVGLKAEKQ